MSPFTDEQIIGHPAALNTRSDGQGMLRLSGLAQSDQSHCPERLRPLARRKPTSQAIPPSKTLVPVVGVHGSQR